MSRRVLFVLGGARPGGNTERLARHAAAGLPPGAEVRWLRLAEHPLPPFEDRRHGGAGYGPPEGPAAAVLEATLWATDLVVAAPTYWYGLPAAAKLWLDHWSGWLRVPGLDFQARLAGATLWAITVNADDPGVEGTSDLLVETLRRAAGYMGLRFGGAVVGHGNRPGDVEADVEAVRAAERLLA